MNLSTSTKRRLLWATGVLVILLALAFSLAPKPVPADFAPVQRGAMEVSLDHEGKTRIQDRFLITAPFDGRLARIELEPGDPVRQGTTVLATLRPSASALLDLQTRERAEADVKAAESRLAAAIAERQRARLERDLAETESARVAELVEQGFASQIEGERASTGATTATATLEAAEAAVATARFQLEGARARLRAGQLGGETERAVQAQIHAPIDGIVLRRNQQSEVPVRTGEVLLEIGDPEDLEVVADYLSNDAVQIEAGMPATFEQWGGERALKGFVRRVEPAGFLKISALGVEEQRVNVILDFDSPYDAWSSLGDEYRVEVRVITWRTEDALLVPTNALFRHSGDWATFVVENHRAVLRSVDIGHRNALHAEVLEGLVAGDTVIAHPSEWIEDGVTVEAREP